MGILSAAKALLTSDGIIKSGEKALDAVYYSKEEKTQDDLEYMKAKAELIKTSSASNITRRILAAVTAFNWVLLQLVWLAYWGYIVFFIDTTEGLAMAKFGLESLEKHKVETSEIFWLVMAFYFSTAAIGKIPAAIQAMRKNS